jgi:hypothetical protein
MLERLISYSGTDKDLEECCCSILESTILAFGAGNPKKNQYKSRAV